MVHQVVAGTGGGDGPGVQQWRRRAGGGGAGWHRARGGLAIACAAGRLQDVLRGGAVRGVEPRRPVRSPQNIRWHCPFPTVLSNAALKGEPLARESQLYSFTHRLAPHLGFGLAGLAWWLTAKQTCFVSPHFTGLERPGYHPEKGYHPLSSKTRGDPVVWRTSNHLPPRAGDLAQTLVGVLVVCKHVKLCSPTLGNYPPHGVLNA